MLRKYLFGVLNNACQKSTALGAKLPFTPQKYTSGQSSLVYAAYLHGKVVLSRLVALAAKKALRKQNAPEVLPGFLKVGRSLTHRCRGLAQGRTRRGVQFNSLSRRSRTLRRRNWRYLRFLRTTPQYAADAGHFGGNFINNHMRNKFVISTELASAAYLFKLFFVQHFLLPLGFLLFLPLHLFIRCRLKSGYNF